MVLTLEQVQELRKAWSSGGTSVTHYEGCYKDHPRCAIEMLARTCLVGAGAAVDEAVRRERERAGQLVEDALRKAYAPEVDALVAQIREG